MEMSGVFWGAFDLMTEAHLRIMTICLEKFPLDPLIVVVNNHSYKKYRFPLKIRMEKIWEALSPEQKKRVLLKSQEDSQKMDYHALSQITHKPLCAIAGYDAYRSWNYISKAEDRISYHKIIVVPRGTETPHLFDSHAELLHIEDRYRFVSSTHPI